MAFNSGGTLGGAPIASEPASAAGKPIVLTGSIATQPLAGGPMAASTIVTQTGNQARVAATEARDTAAFVAWNTNATLAATEAKDTAAVQVDLFGFASLSGLEYPDIASFAASDLNVSFALTEAPDAAAINFAVTGTMAMAATEAPDSYSQTAYILWLKPDEPDDPSIWVPKNDPAPYLTTVI